MLQVSHGCSEASNDLSARVFQFEYQVDVGVFNLLPGSICSVKNNTASVNKNRLSAYFFAEQSCGASEMCCDTSGEITVIAETVCQPVLVGSCR